MTAPPEPPPNVRIGNDERDAAMRALGEHLSAGRLDPDEYGERVARVSVARTFADLEPLFRDLPEPRPRPPTSVVSLTKPAPGAPARSEDGKSEPLSGRLGETLVALSPFIALALFFLSPMHTWIVFLLVPIAGALVYGNANHRHRRR